MNTVNTITKTLKANPLTLMKLYPGTIFRFLKDYPSKFVSTNQIFIKSSTDCDFVEILPIPNYAANITYRQPDLESSEVQIYNSEIKLTPI